MKRKMFTEDDLTTMQKMRGEGAKMQAIADAVGKTKKSVQNKIYGLAREGKFKLKPGPKTKRAYKLRKFKAASEEILPAAQPNKKPLIVMVGDHSEITAAIKELFS